MSQGRPGPAVATDTRPASRAVSSYAPLAAQVRRSGLLERRTAYYWTSFGAVLLALTAVVVAMTALGDSWWQLALAAALGVLLGQCGFLGHDAAHRQVFGSAAWNDGAARVLSGLFVGLSSAWWRGKHNRHHAAPNQEGRDPDIAPGPLAFTPAVAERRTRGLAGWYLRHQGWLFFPLLTLEGANLHWQSVRHLASRTPVRHRWTEISLLATRTMAYAALLAWLLPAPKAVLFVVVQTAVLGVCLGASFAPNHKGMPIVPPTSRIDFLQRQVLMSRNVRGGPVVDLLMGGLNYQIEHHLFPSMPRPHLRRAQPLVRAYCADLGVPYTERGVWASYAAVVVYLNDVGLRARGPFECPLASELRGGR